MYPVVLWNVRHPAFPGEVWLANRLTTVGRDRWYLRFLRLLSLVVALLVPVTCVCVVAVGWAFRGRYLARPLLIAPILSLVTALFADGLPLRVVYGVYRQDGLTVGQ